MKFDELNILKDYDYFEPMAISADSKARRRELANFLTDAFLYFFSVFEVHSLHKSMLEKAMYEQLLADRISDAVSKVTGIDGEMSKHIRQLAKDVVNTTYEHADNKKRVGQLPLKVNDNDNDDDDDYAALYESNESSDFPLDSSGDSVLEEQRLREEDDLEEEEIVEKMMDDEDEEEAKKKKAKRDYWLSFDRASSIANSEANTFFNYTDFKQAQERGYTKKTWRTMLDDLVRDTHAELEGLTIGINEYFNVGTSQMRFPHDWESDPYPGDVANCRCSVDYK